MARSLSLRPTHEEIFCYSQGRWHDDTLYLAGLTSLDEHGELLHAGDLAAQLTEIYAIASRLLASEGLGPGDILREVIYTTDMARWSDASGTRQGVYASVRPPPGTVVEVRALADPGALIELELTVGRPTREPETSVRSSSATQRPATRSSLESKADGGPA